MPGLLEWPGRIKKATRTSIPVCSSDYVPTVMEILGLKDKTHMDGISLVSLIDGKMERRAKPILFQSRNQVAMIDNEWKLYRRGGKGKFELYNLKEDVGEKNDLSAKHGQQVSEMRKAIQQWQQSLNR